MTHNIKIRTYQLRCQRRPCHTRPWFSAHVLRATWRLQVDWRAASARSVARPATWTRPARGVTMMPFPVPRPSRTHTERNSRRRYFRLAGWMDARARRTRPVGWLPDWKSCALCELMVYAYYKCVGAWHRTPHSDSALARLRTARTTALQFAVCPHNQNSACCWHGKLLLWDYLHLVIILEKFHNCLPRCKKWTILLTNSINKWKNYNEWIIKSFNASCQISYFRVLKIVPLFLVWLLNNKSANTTFVNLS